MVEGVPGEKKAGNSGSTIILSGLQALLDHDGDSSVRLGIEEYQVPRARHVVATIPAAHLQSPLWRDRQAGVSKARCVMDIRLPRRTATTSPSGGENHLKARATTTRAAELLERTIDSQSVAAR